MSFLADRQTLSDLNITGKYKPGSIFSLFNQVHTSGGEKLLEQLFNHPLTDADEINSRSSIFNFFQQQTLNFPVTQADFDQAENYLNSYSANNKLTAGINNLKSMIAGSVVSDMKYEMLKDGLLAAIKVFDSFASFYKGIEKRFGDSPYTKETIFVCNIFNDKRLAWIDEYKGAKDLSFLKVCKYDYLLKHTLKNKIEELLHSIYHLDVYLAVSRAAAVRNFTYAKALPAHNNVFNAEKLFHPALTNAVGNDIHLDNSTNMMFLTGANMAGKSTLMKTFGIAVYLAHMGFPIAAKSMQFSIKDGIYSSINVPDDLGKGYSHFYAEVLRVKTAAQAVTSSKNMVVMFDELFKGTNVKDAYEATLAVTEAFAEYQNCFFIISTHIIEVGEALQPNASNIGFNYMPTVMDGPNPTYPYRLTKGITSDRQGMIIIENEGILELLTS